ncbi:MAG: hypothetical protein H7321_00815 [Bacteroidia bacterium]|nr:hypothetical protein [Bacteroidia bacterium]
MLKITSAFLIAFALIPSANCQTKLSQLQQKQQITKLAGCFEVSFDYHETYTSDTSYKLHEPYKANGLEYVVLEEKDAAIMLQHLLIVNDSLIIKHWREDWTKGGGTLFTYTKDNQWHKEKKPATDNEYSWTQKVYQVSDALRYQSVGNWRQLESAWYWESQADAPLPRREFTHRNDYNVLNRRNRLMIEDNNIVFEQDNKKIIRAQSDSLLTIEKGYEIFKRVETSRCNVAINWWDKNKGYWKIVRTVWEEIYASNNNIEIINDRALYESLFALNDIYNLKPEGDKETAVKIKGIIMQNLKTSL